VVDRLRRADPGLFGLRSAARAAIVMPSVFAFADNVIGNPQTSIFAAFGSFAVLVFADFGGPPRTRLLAYVVLAGTGAVFIPLATLCSRNPWIAAAAMFVVGFLVLFSGVINGYFAAGGTAALLLFVLPVSMAVPPSAIPDRLLGWALAAGVGISAQLLLWPRRPRDKLAPLLADACRKLATATEEASAGEEARTAIGAARDQFYATPYRPTGPTEAPRAITYIIDELDWYRSLLLGPASASRPPPLCRSENGVVIDASAAALRAAADRFEGKATEPDLERLDQARDALVRGVPAQVAGQPDGDGDTLLAALEPSFRVRAISFAAGQIARNAVLATAGVRTPARPALHAVRRLAAEHADVRSQWFRDSLRGAIALAVAVFVAKESEVANGFWVVLGTLSVLRSNVLGTGATVVQALVGTAIGIVIGAALVVAIGTDTGALWAVLPVAVLVASYAPRLVSFAAGQAGFTTVLLILFNIIQPKGWTVGLVRIQDVAIGFGISLVVGLLFWPRGAASLVRQSVAGAYVTAAEFVDAAVGRLLERGEPPVPQAEARAAQAAADRLDDAFRHYLAERSAKPVPLRDVGMLVAGAARVRRTALSLVGLSYATDGAAADADDRALLTGDAHALRRWYGGLGDALVEGHPPPDPDAPDDAGRRRLAEQVQRAAAAGDRTTMNLAIALLWAGEHLAVLERMERRLAPPATEAVSLRAHPLAAMRMG
jgi:uncharacterized membrane protein YccC